ncbi:hypothetical protein [Kribbella antiqua]|uniref:hypothetical protein n=1 Tax=Kribbella antiqua TaxID=2512217 RepID=UPI0010469CC6|nr:hypothetical protein [Kribbella antiqua]
MKFDSHAVTHEIQKQRLVPKSNVCYETDCSRRVFSQNVISAAIDAQGETVTPALAAKRVAAILKQTRTVRRHVDHKVEPLGVRVVVNIEILGMRGQPLLLSWSVLQRSGNVPLPDDWLSSIIGYRLQATSERDTGSVDFWVPLPKSPGVYFVSMTLTTAGTPLTSAESKDFE